MSGRNIFINELLSLSHNGIFSIAKIEWWLLKYHEEYKREYEVESNRFMYLIDGRWVRLPDYFDVRTPEEKFLKIYKDLELMSDFHKNENYFKQEIADYKRIKDYPEKVMAWLKKNEELGSKKYICFLDDYFADEDPWENDLHVEFNIPSEKMEIGFVDRSDFINTFEFMYIFNNIYWELLEMLDVSELN